MNPISVSKFVELTIKSNPDLKREQLTSDLLDAAKRKNDGAVCINCKSPIWAIGSAICGWDGCFSCITGEADDSDDYELDIVKQQD